MNKTLILGKKIKIMENKEIWKDVEGYEGKYQVSSFGRVRSFKHGKERYLRAAPNDKGYLRVVLCSDIKKNYFVHRLICDAFHPNPENKSSVNHKNGIKYDNRAENLEWVTHSENHKHAFKNGYMCKKGSKHHLSKLTEQQVMEIKYGHKGLLQKEIAKLYGVSARNISLIRLDKRWKHI
jgi:hypothetical protein